MAPKLYMFPASPAVRAVLICAKAIGVDLELIIVNLMNGEHLTPEYLKMNPQHTIPTLDDDGFILWESHAILPYLVGKYGKNKSLYPENLKKRAVIDQRMHFNSNLLFPRGAAIMKTLFQGATDVPENQKQLLIEAYDILEIFLENTKFVAGNDLSIADFCIATSINSFSAFVPIDKSKYPKINCWLNRIQKLPYYDEANKEGMEMFRAMVVSKLSN